MPADVQHWDHAHIAKRAGHRLLNVASQLLGAGQHKIACAGRHLAFKLGNPAL